MIRRPWRDTLRGPPHPCDRHSRRTSVDAPIFPHVFMTMKRTPAYFINRTRRPRTSSFSPIRWRTVDKRRRGPQDRSPVISAPPLFSGRCTAHGAPGVSWRWPSGRPCRCLPATRCAVDRSDPGLFSPSDSYRQFIVASAINLKTRNPAPLKTRVAIAVIRFPDFHTTRLFAMTPRPASPFAPTRRLPSTLPGACAAGRLR